MSASKLIHEISAKLKKLRLDQKIGQTEVANALGISVAALSKIENGLTDLNISRLAQMATYFQVPMSSIFGEGESSSLISPQTSEEISSLKKKLLEKDAEVNQLQKKVIKLYEKLDL